MQKIVNELNLKNAIENKPLISVHDYMSIVCSNFLSVLAQSENAPLSNKIYLLEVKK